MASTSTAAAPLGENIRQRNAIVRSSRGVWKFARQKPLAGFGLAVCIGVCLLALFADAIAPFAYDALVGGSLESPNSTHWMGTDRLGRDTFSRIAFGARVSIVVGLASVTMATVIAAVIGISSVSGPKFVDLVSQRFVDAFMAFPSLVFLLTVTTIVGSSVPGMVFVLGILFGVSSSRVVRSAALAVSSEDYILAGRCVGCSWFRLQWRYILPNIMPSLIVLATVTVGAAILAEAAVSFLGFGIQPPTPTWGRMLSTDLEYMTQQPWLAVWPGLALTLTVFAFNVLGDGLRDVLDPKLRNR